MFNTKFRKSIGFQFLSVMSIVLFLGTLVLSLVIAINEWSVLRKSITISGQSLASFIAKLGQEPLIIKDGVQLDAIVNDANKDEDVVYTVIHDEQGNPMTSQYASVNYRSPRLMAILSELPRNSGLHDIIDGIKKREMVIELTVPIMIEPRQVGSVTIGMSGYRIRQQIAKTVLFIIGLNMVVALVLGIALFLAAKKLILDPLAELAHAATAIAGGNLSTHVDIRTTGEVKMLVDSFNQMSADLNKTTVSKEYVDNIIKSTIDTLIVVSPAGIIERANSAACALLGRGETELIGRPFEILLEDNAFNKHNMHEVFSGHSVQHVEMTYVTKDGRHVPMLVSGSAMFGSDNRLFGAVFAATEITERKRAEEERFELERRLQQAQKLESLGVLAGGIAHDFNNLLMAILGHAELALDNLSPTAPARDNLQQIQKASIRAADLCRQMLAYSGKGQVVVKRVDLRKLVEEITYLLKTSISKKAVLNLNLQADLPAIEADASQIRQIVMNLIINASEAIGENSGVITVSTGVIDCSDDFLQESCVENDLASGLYVYLEVADTGCGMDAETQRRIFEPFFTTKFTGRGLGLSAVLGIMRAHKGTLSLQSEPGRGSTFKAIFPAVPAPQEEEQRTIASGDAPWRGRGTVLLVDDEEIVRTACGKMLESLGYSVITAVDGREALDIYRERSDTIDLVLLDMTMPHMDGMETSRELRRHDPKARVIISSGYTVQDIESRFAGTGLDGFIQKPFTVKGLQAELDRVLGDTNDLSVSS
ncbi:MAG: response regulator [Nitrospirae bacterium]|nr:response regulator [Nitrospirota bacterium]